MLRAVFVPGKKANDDGALHLAPISRHGQLGQYLRSLVDGCGAPDLDTAPRGVVDEKDMHTIVLGEIAECDVLPIAGKISERQRRVIEYPQKSRRAAAMLNVGLTVGARCRQEE